MRACRSSIPRSSASSLHTCCTLLFLPDLLKLPRLLRLGRLTKKMEVFAAARAFRIVIMLLTFVLISHILACLWFYLTLAMYEVCDCCLRVAVTVVCGGGRRRHRRHRRHRHCAVVGVVAAVVVLAVVIVVVITATPV